MILFLPFFPPHADTSNSSPSHFKVIHYFPPSLICGGFPDGSVGKESTCSAGDTGDMGSVLWLGRSPGGGNGKPTPVFLLEICHGQSGLVGYSLWGPKELDVTEAQLSFSLLNG